MANFPLGDITSANARLVLIVDNLFPAGVPLQQFATDQSFAQDELTIAETRMGVDGGFVAGWIPSIKPVSVMLEATSPSYTFLNTLYQACEMKRGIYRCTLIATVPSIMQVFTWLNGVLKSGTPVPSGKKVLDPTTWKFEFSELKIVGL